MTGRRAAAFAATVVVLAVAGAALLGPGADDLLVVAVSAAHGVGAPLARHPAATPLIGTFLLGVVLLISGVASLRWGRSDTGR